jgi:hypothetical protein
VRAASPKGIGALRASANATAAASLALKFTGGRVWAGSMV